MNVLVIGSNGQLGHALATRRPPEIDARFIGRQHLDLADPATIPRVLDTLRPDLIINAAAYTAVDQAEQEETLATTVNSEAPAILADSAARLGARLIHISTDFVFDGKRNTPYPVNADTNPTGVYGRSKLAGEQAVLAGAADRVVLRTSWLYHHHGNNFVRTMLRLMRERDALSVVIDQVGSPTWADGLAIAIWRIAELPEINGILHWSDLGVTSWFDFAVAIQRLGCELGMLERAIPINAIASSDYPTPARRPHYSLLDTTTTSEQIGITPRHWERQLHDMLRALQARGAA